MEVSDALRLKTELERNIAASVSELVAKFSNSTGLAVSDIGIEVLETHTISSSSPSYVVGRAHINIKF